MLLVTEPDCPLTHGFCKERPGGRVYAGPHCVVPETKNHLRKRNNNAKSEAMNSYIKRITRNWRFSGKRERLLV